MLEILPSKTMLIRVRQSRTTPIKVKTQIAIPDTLNISGIDISQVRDGYVLMYNEELQRYVFVDPDQVLSKSVTLDDQLPEVFVDKLDQDLDNRVNLDAGEF